MVENSADAKNGTPSKKSYNLRNLFWYLIPFLIVGVIGGGIYLFKGEDGESYDFIKRSEPVLVGKNYYVTVTLIEVTQKMGEDGKDWDPMGGLPDLYFQILWRGDEVYESAVKKNTYIAKWSNAEIDLRHLALTGRKVSLDDVVQAARINIAEDEEITIRVYDRDFMRSDDLAGEFVLKTTQLRIGDTEYLIEKDSLKKIVVRVADIEKGLDILK
ncbi:MAG: hypothetical protein ACOX2O_01880 [Bdellovibrionota bacterium]|jgi:uncharacterized ubiquitin-like protein YukD